MISKLSVIVPAYNEGATISQLLERVLAVELIENIQMEIIVVDDCSSDNTIEKIESIAQKFSTTDLKILRHEKNSGKGAALHTGIAKASGDYIVIQDADLECDPAEFNKLLVPVLKANADAVYGSRFIGGEPRRILFFWHTIGNKFLTFFSNLFTNLSLTDMETCYKLIRADILKNFDLKEKRFGFEPEVTAKLAKIKGISIYEVGISFYGRTYEEGKKIGWRDGVRALIVIVKYGLFSK